MKAMILVNIPVSKSEFIDVGFLAKVSIYPSIASEKHYEFENVFVRPVPNKTRKNTQNMYWEGYTEGWNDCVQFIIEE